MNYSAALQWHLIYIRYLLHDSTTATNEIEKKIQKVIRSKIKTENEQRLCELKACMRKLRGLMLKSGPIAEKQTILRNSKEALIQQDRWIEMSFMNALRESIDTEGWARLKSLQERIKLCGLESLLKVFECLKSFLC